MPLLTDLNPVHIITNQGWDDDTTELEQWLRSFYWSITTITTVGYGDISAGTNAEMVRFCHFFDHFVTFSITFSIISSLFPSLFRSFCHFFHHFLFAGLHDFRDDPGNTFQRLVNFA